MHQPIRKGSEGYLSGAEYKGLASYLLPGTLSVMPVALVAVDRELGGSDNRRALRMSSPAGVYKYAYCSGKYTEHGLRVSTISTSTFGTQSCTLEYSIPLTGCDGINLADSPQACMDMHSPNQASRGSDALVRNMHTVGTYKLVRGCTGRKMEVRGRHSSLVRPEHLAVGWRIPV